MPVWVKRVWISAVAVNTVSLVWFFLGSTANFQRPLYFLERILFVIAWTPSLILVLTSIKLLRTGWVPVPANTQNYVLLWLVILSLLYFAFQLFIGVDTRGWLYDYIRQDPIKTTSDGKYEYRIELVNNDQRNRQQRLYIKDLSTGNELYIRVEMSVDKKLGWSRPRGDNWGWAILEPTDVSHLYELTTTENLELPKMKFLIDIETGTSQRLE